MTLPKVAEASVPSGTPLVQLEPRDQFPLVSFFQEVLPTASCETIRSMAVPVVSLPSIEPVPARVRPLTVTLPVPVPLPEALFTASVPAETVVPPLYVLAPLRVTDPALVLVMAPVPPRLALMLPLCTANELPER